MNTNKSSNSFNRLFLILNCMWIGFALLTVLLFLGGTLSIKNSLNNSFTNGISDSVLSIGVVDVNGSNSDVHLNALGIVSILFLAISIVSSIALIVTYSIFQPTRISKTYFAWTMGFILFTLVFTSIISMLGTPYNFIQFTNMVLGNKQNTPIISNMLSIVKNAQNVTTAFNLGGGSISILLVNIVVFCTLIVTISNLAVRYKKSKDNMENLDINNNQLNLQ